MVNAKKLYSLLFIYIIYIVINYPFCINYNYRSFGSLLFNFVVFVLFFLIIHNLDPTFYAMLILLSS